MRRAWDESPNDDGSDFAAQNAEFTANAEYYITRLNALMASSLPREPRFEAWHEFFVARKIAGVF